MGQYEVIKYLERKKEPVSRREIVEALKDNESKISHIVKKLLDNKEIKFIEISRLEAKIRFKENPPARRLRLYFIE